MRKEALELRRDPVLAGMSLFGTALLMFVMGYGISLDVENLSFAVLDHDQTGLSQSYATRAEAFAAIRRGVNWKIADAGQIEEGARHYVEFSFRLDTSLLPRPMQIGIATQPDWALSVERMQRFD